MAELRKIIAIDHLQKHYTIGDFSHLKYCIECLIVPRPLYVVYIPQVIKASYQERLPLLEWLVDLEDRNFVTSFDNGIAIFGNYESSMTFHMLFADMDA